jgi:hypothetical protein
LRKFSNILASNHRVKLGANCTLAFVICLAELQTIRVRQGIWIMDPAPKACLDGLDPSFRSQFQN